MVRSLSVLGIRREKKQVFSQREKRRQCVTAAVVRAAEQDQRLFRQRQQAESKSELQNPVAEAPALQIAAAAADQRLVFTCPQCEKIRCDKPVFSITPTQSQQSHIGVNSECLAAIYIYVCVCIYIYFFFFSFLLENSRLTENTDYVYGREDLVNFVYCLDVLICSIEDSRLFSCQYNSFHL